jgi:hypothetical protein
MCNGFFWVKSMTYQTGIINIQHARESSLYTRDGGDKDCDVPIGVQDLDQNNADA